MKKLSSFKNKIYNGISNLSYKQKFMYSIIGLLILLVITFVITRMSKSGDLDIDYNNVTGDELYTMSNIISDNNIYVQVKEVADNFISVSSQDSLDNYIKNIYNYCLTSSYKNSISRRDFINKSKEFNEKVGIMISTNVDIVPDSITQYVDNYYLVKYVINDDNGTQEAYLGIVLDSSTKKYYIWYLE